MVLPLRKQTEDLTQLPHPMSLHFSEGLLTTRLVGNLMSLLGTCHLLAYAIGDWSDLPSPDFF